MDIYQASLDLQKELREKDVKFRAVSVVNSSYLAVTFPVEDSIPEDLPEEYLGYKVEYNQWNDI